MSETSYHETRQSPLTALAILPSGPIPWRHQVLALAALTFEGRKVLGRFETLLRPGRRVPEYARRVLATADEAWDEAPTFRDVEPRLRAFLGETTLVGYGVRVMLEFLAAELARVNRPGFANPEIELAELAQDRGLGAGKPSLSGLAAVLRLTQMHPGQPLADVRLTAQITALLLDRPEAATTVEPPSLPHRWALLDPSRVRGTAEAPGVYIFRDSDGRPLYAGAASNLRRRLATYQSKPLSLERRLEGLAQRVWDIETRDTAGFLEALIEEARVIAESAPPFNTQRRLHTGRRFIRAQPDPPAPGLRLVAEVAADGAVYIGPFASASRAQQALTLARAVYPALRGRAVIGRARKRGREPTSDTAGAERSEAVRQAVRFFSGQRQEALAAIGQRQTAARRDGDLALADRLLDLGRQVRHFELVPSPLINGDTARFAVILGPSMDGSTTVYHIASGRILDRLELADEAELEPLLEGWRMSAPAVEPDPVALPLIMRWLALMGPRCRIVSLPTAR